jgi:hypothetical protein
MIKSYGKTSNGELAAHEENVVSFLYADERYLDSVEDAEDLGTGLSASVCRTHADPPPVEGEDKFSPDYESELRVDFVCDGYVMMNRPKEGRAVQMSVGAPLVRPVESLLIRKLEMIPYDELTEDESFFFAIEDFLDEIEDDGIGVQSPFRDNEDEHDVPEGPLGVMTAEDREGADLIELQSGDFDGRFERDDSLYFSRDGFFPFRVLFAHVLDDRYQNGGVWRLSQDDCRAAAELLEAIDEIPDSLSTFSDLLSELSVYEYAPTDRAERLLTKATLARRDAFKSDAVTLLDWFLARIEEDSAVTVVDL